MSRVVKGTFNGTGAALYVGLGFIPSRLRLVNKEDGDLARLEFSYPPRSSEQEEGVLLVGSGAALQISALTHGNGVCAYHGGDKLAAASTAYLKKDPSTDKRSVNTGYDPINKWTLGSTTNRTGNWNAECSTNWVGEGSRICIDGKWYTVTALTSNGEAANEVTLDRAAPSGEIQALLGMYDWIGGSAGDVIPAGFQVNATTVINVSGEMVEFEAEE